MKLYIGLVTVVALGTIGLAIGVVDVTIRLDCCRSGNARSCRCVASDHDGGDLTVPEEHERGGVSHSTGGVVGGTGDTCGIRCRLLHSAARNARLLATVRRVRVGGRVRNYAVPPRWMALSDSHEGAMLRCPNCGADAYEGEDTRTTVELDGFEFQGEKPVRETDAKICPECGEVVPW